MVFPAQAGVIPVSDGSRSQVGSIPRASGGDPMQNNSSTIERFVFPAQAGVIPLPVEAGQVLECIPRASGGDP